MQAHTQKILAAAQDILGSYDYQITIRQLYYRLVATHVVENSAASYKRLVALLTKAREEGSLDPESFVDLTRRSEAPPGYDNLGDFVAAVAQAYSRDRWQGQKNYVEVWVEKEALATVFERPCRAYQVRLVVCRGYTSISALVEASRRFQDAGDKRAHLLYFGDFDPSGQDIPRAVCEGLQRWGGVAPRFRLVALTAEQIAKHNLPPAPAKSSDTRTARFVAAHGEDTVELDALPPDVLAELIAASMEELIDPAAWAEQGEMEKADLVILKHWLDQANGMR
jgi:hypothetical protein